MNGIVYKSTNKINGKGYVGITRKSLKERISWHQQKSKSKKKIIGFAAAIYKYGIENFDWEILEECDELQLSEKEIFHIKNHKTHVTENGYNITWGGETIFGGSGKYHFLNLMSPNEKSNWIKKYRVGKNNGMYGNGKLVSGKNHFLNKMTEKEREDWKNKNIRGNNNYQHKMTKDQLIEKNWYNKISDSEREEFSKKMSGDNNPFRKAYLKNPEKYQKLWKKGQNNVPPKIYVIIFPDSKMYKIYAIEFSKKYVSVKVRAHGIYACANGFISHYKGMVFEKYDEIKHSGLDWYKFA